MKVNTGRHGDTQTRRRLNHRISPLARWADCPIAFSPPAAPIRRRGVIVVTFAVILVVMLGLLGLVIDGGFLLSSHRQAQSAADAAALAYAMDKLSGQTDATATATANTFVHDYNGLPDATVTLNVPPSSGPFKDEPFHVEAIVTTPVRTLFIHILGISRFNQVTARAVANWDELVSGGDGVLVLDPRTSESPGLAVAGQGRLWVDGGIFDNNEGGGVDENGNPVNSNNNFASTGGQQNSPNGIFTDDFWVVGGVDDPTMYKNIATGTSTPNILHAGSLPLPDPLASMETPSVANGVIDSGLWPSVSVGSADTNGDGIQDTLVVNVDPAIATVPTVNLSVDVNGVTWVVLSPDIYKRITITGDPNIAKVRLLPGIYVIKAGGNKALTVNGGEVIGEGVMIYNTGANYDPLTGEPDASDPFDPGNVFPPPSPNQSGTTFGDVTLNSKLILTPIDTALYAYPNPAIAAFNRMLFYQRRGNAQAVALQGNGVNTILSGTIYTKWSRFKLQGQANYDAQFVVGTMDIAGNADVTLDFAGEGGGKAPLVFLVE